MDMADLLGGSLPQVMRMLVDGAEITPETMAQDWSLAELPQFTEAELAKIHAEVRIVPEETENGGTAYEVSVWLRLDDQEVNVSGLIPSLTVSIAVDDLVTEENRKSFTALYTLAHQAQDAAAATALPSKLLKLPGDLPMFQEDTAEHFLVTVSGEEELETVTACSAGAPLTPYRHDVLAAKYAGEGWYFVSQAE